MNMVLQQRVEDISWRLLYADGRVVTEPPSGGTIKESWLDPIELQLINKAEQVRYSLPIPKGASPIFYRRKSMDYQFTTSIGQHQSGQPILMLGAGKLVAPMADNQPIGKTDVTVFGWATEDLMVEWADDKKQSGKAQGKTSGHLEAVTLFGNSAQIHNPCPEKWIDQTAIEALITRKW